MQPRPIVIVFDVNETLSDMAPMARRFADVGAPELLAQVWFASLLRDGFALGMHTGWIPRQPTPYPDYFAAPELQAPDLVALARQIVS
jgi:FMN phosphatase YigB (HAD superfamily)